MSYHASNPFAAVERHYIDLSQPLMGLGEDVPTNGPGTFTQVSEPFEYYFSNKRFADPINAPWASDLNLRLIQQQEHQHLPPARWTFGPWIPNEGPIARAVHLTELQPYDGSNVAALTLANWLASVTQGAMTGKWLYVVMGWENNNPVLYALTEEEYKALPLNTYVTVALPRNWAPTKKHFDSIGLPSGPVIGDPTSSGGGSTPWPTIGGGGASSSGSMLDPWTLFGAGAATAASSGSIFPLPSTTPGGASAQAPQSSSPSVGPIVAGGILLVVAGTVYYYLHKSQGLQAARSLQGS